MRAARLFPERGITIIDSRGRSEVRRTYVELLAGVQRTAGAWRALGLLPGERVLILQPTSWAFLDAWLGAVLAGALPVAVAPASGLGTAGNQLEKIIYLVERLGARFVLSADSLRQGASTRPDGAALAARIVTVEQLAGLAPLRLDVPLPWPEDSAFLQLTSGSTGWPRAVAISHRAVLHNAAAIDESLGAPAGGPCHTWADALVSWLPLHHDMGLVGCLMVALTGGIELKLLPPTAFLARPRLWLEQIGRHRAVFAHAPNFGYQLCVERLVETAGLDLSAWRYAITGAEMVRPETVAAFLERFGAVGFRPEAFRPCYGLAEATLAVTVDRAGRGLRTRALPTRAERLLDPELQEVACVGEPVDATSVRITGPSGLSLGPGEIGEVRVQGPGLFSGYFNDVEASAESLSEYGGRAELRTGDLGFLHAGELYLTGRLKDLLIVRGHNFMPHEVEWLAESVVSGGGALRSGAFSVAHGGQGEQAVVVLESTERDPERQAVIARDVKLRVSEGLGMLLSEVVLVRRGTIPKTTSGKVQRRALKELYLRGGLSGAGEEANDELG